MYKKSPRFLSLRAPSRCQVCIRVERRELEKANFWIRALERKDKNCAQMAWVKWQTTLFVSSASGILVCRWWLFQRSSKEANWKRWTAESPNWDSSSDSFGFVRIWLNSPGKSSRKFFGRIVYGVQKVWSPWAWTLSPLDSNTPIGPEIYFGVYPKTPHSRCRLFKFVRKMILKKSKNWAQSGLIQCNRFLCNQTANHNADRGFFGRQLAKMNGQRHSPHSIRRPNATSSA